MTNNNPNNSFESLNTIINSERTELTKEEILLLLEYRMADEQGRKEIEKLIKKMNTQI